MNVRLLAVVLTAAASAEAVSAATLNGLWLFDNPGNLAQATVGTDLAFTGAAPGAWSATLADDQSDTLSGVVTTPAAVQGNQFIATHGIAPNGGGAFVNQYSIVVDLFSPAGSRGSWRTIMQTNQANSNDGDFFIHTNDTIGVAALTYSASPINETSWTRLVVTFDLGISVRSYLDGALFHTHSAGTVDGRFSLDPTVLFFSDENGDNAPLNIGALAIYNGVLSPAEVAALGVAGTAIPEPGSTAFGLAALLGFARRRRA